VLEPITTPVKISIRARLLISRYINVGGLKTEVLYLYKILPTINRFLSYKSYIDSLILP